MSAPFTQASVAEKKDSQIPPIANGVQNQVLVLIMRQNINAVITRNSSMKITAAAVEGRYFQR